MKILKALFLILIINLGFYLAYNGDNLFLRINGLLIGPSLMGYLIASLK